MNTTLFPVGADLELSAPDAFRFYRQALELLVSSRVPFLVGGAYAFAHYTSIIRHTKDFDVFVRREDVPTLLRHFADAGFRAEMCFTHWLAKVYHGEEFVDIIFASGNGVCPVDDDYFAHADHGEALGIPVRFMPAEEMIWQKAFIMERERFDGADVNHLLLARGPRLDWDRLLARFGDNWRVLLGHLILFGFVYPDERGAIPPHVLGKLLARLDQEPREANGNGVCRGTLLSRTQYLPDTEQWGYADPRTQPLGPMTNEETARWTDAGR